MSYKPYGPSEYRISSNSIEFDKIGIDEAIKILRKAKNDNPDCVISTSVCSINIFHKNKHYEEQNERHTVDLIKYHRNSIKELGG